MKRARCSVFGNYRTPNTTLGTYATHEYHQVDREERTYRQTPAKGANRSRQRKYGAHPLKDGSTCRSSVEEVAGSCEVHGDAGRLGCRDDFIVAFGASGLDDGGDSGVDQDLQAVGEREERV